MLFGRDFPQGAQIPDLVDFKIHVIYHMSGTEMCLGQYAPAAK